MNLIMSEVEETIMLVDAESVANGHGVVNVWLLFFWFFFFSVIFVGRETEDGYVVCERGWSYSCAFFWFCFPFFLLRRYSDKTGITTIEDMKKKIL